MVKTKIIVCKCCKQDVEVPVNSTAEFCRNCAEHHQYLRTQEFKRYDNYKKKLEEKYKYILSIREANKNKDVEKM